MDPEYQRQHKTWATFIRPEDKPDKRACPCLFWVDKHMIMTQPQKIMLQEKQILENICQNINCRKLLEIAARAKGSLPDLVVDAVSACRVNRVDEFHEFWSLG